ncbi:hypothetical protein P280DRAFT_288397 [Massarina eburnea CBS 473.64]|uniref:C2H2-type domain-containing protein n=1 Tax=Massarina eburnea CBS 473.64 TaxID=1395130 RepID=A0A6A6S477_9PLEO|nr:hypothetical protein P280DRAFT_288397 [Massarina eburnea CBS 473.64]
MSFPGPADLNGQRREEYHVSPTMVPTSGFLTPPYNMEMRRDSVASSQSSMSSFASCMSEYSGPITPTAPPSPTNEEGFVDVMAYHFGHGLQSHTFHGLPMDHPTKVVTSDEHMPGPWQLVPHRMDVNEPIPNPFAQQMIPTDGEISQSHMADDTGLETTMTMSSTVGSPWVNISSSSFHADLGRQWDHHGPGQVISDDHMQMLWPTDMHTASSSHSMMAVAGSYIEPVYFPSSDAFDNSAFPQSPQEVSFKREASEVLKQESDTEEVFTRSRLSIAVTPKGGKTVKKEENRTDDLSRRGSRISKRRGASTSISKKRELNTSFISANIACELDGFERVFDDAGRVSFQRTREPGPKPKKCGFPGCSKSFRRPEHRKRHEDTHKTTGVRRFPCLICQRPFDRNDNCQEHVWTHVAQPGKKGGRNQKYSMQEVESYCTDPVEGPKLIEKLRKKWKQACQEAGMVDSLELMMC